MPAACAIILFARSIASLSGLPAAMVLWLVRAFEALTALLAIASGCEIDPLDLAVSSAALGTPNARARSWMLRALGCASPFSHFQMVTDDTPVSVASLLTDNPRLTLRALSRSAKPCAISVNRLTP